MNRSFCRVSAVQIYNIKIIIGKINRRTCRITDFNFLACYKAYFKIAEKLFPNKPAYDIYTVLEDWAMTLAQSFPCDHNLSGFIDNLSMMSVAVFLRDITNPYHTNSLVDKMSQSYYFTTNFAGRRSPQIIYAKMPSVAARTEAPLIYACGIDESLTQNEVLQADGFMAAVFNLALYYYWQRRWSEFNFTDTKVIEQVLNAYKRKEPIIDLADLRRLSFNLPDEIEDICKAYMEAFMPVMQKVWKMTPTVQLACVEGDYIYTYIYAHEISSPERLLASELYANLSNIQKQTIYHYGRRFLEWIRKTYPITPSTEHYVTQAMGMDLPPIQVSIQNDVQITHAGKQPKEEKPKKPKQKYCTYIVPNAGKTRDEIEADLVRASQKSANTFVRLLISYEENGYLDFRDEAPADIFEYLKDRYNLKYSLGNFTRYFKR